MSHCAGQRYQQPAHTYYYNATSGSDAAAGNSEHSPLQTVAGFNARTFKPDDRVLWKSGESWTTTRVVIPSSGKPGKPIRLGSYGAGAKPIFTGPDTYSLSTGAQSFVSLSNLDIDGNDACTYAAHTAGHDIEFHGCIARSGIEMGFFAWGGVTVVYNLIYDGCEMHSNAQSGLHAGADSSPGPAEVTVSDCIAHDNGSDVAAHHGIYLKYGGHNRVRRNTCYNNAAGGIKINDETVPATRPTLVDTNNCYDNGDGILLSAALTTVQNNILYSNTNSGIQALSDANDSNIFHNTAVNNGYSGLRFQDGATALEGMVIKNNLIHQDLAVVGEGKMPVRMAGDGTLIAAQNTFDKNIYCYTGAASNYVFNCQAVANLTLAEWQAFSGSPDANSLTSEPVFVTEFTDLHIQTTSPAKGAGDASVGVLQDYDGVVRGAQVDIGALEFVA